MQQWRVFMVSSQSPTQNTYSEPPHGFQNAVKLNLFHIRPKPVPDVFGTVSGRFRRLSFCHPNRNPGSRANWVGLSRGNTLHLLCSQRFCRPVPSRIFSFEHFVSFMMIRFHNGFTHFETKTNPAQNTTKKMIRDKFKARSVPETPKFHRATSAEFSRDGMSSKPSVSETVPNPSRIRPQTVPDGLNPSPGRIGSTLWNTTESKSQNLSSRIRTNRYNFHGILAWICDLITPTLWPRYSVKYPRITYQKNVFLRSLSYVA